ncbi:hypothetical protein BD626DRAFT_100707 [Schizophyllum amplum]|uniref:Uncharacterized protein n=1 Tax=Schizophyllum amplum TaxID=97359 RepID=A0A550CRK5_9AGAR|nr:hypothetical protein BD626DRAFT_100707 [Auriculariopsis ampla]
MSSTSARPGFSMRVISGPNPCFQPASSILDSTLAARPACPTLSRSSKPKSKAKPKPKPRTLKTAPPPPPGSRATYRMEAERFDDWSAYIWVAAFSSVGARCAACRRRILADVRSNGRFVIPNLTRHIEEKCKARRRIEKGEMPFPEPRRYEASLEDDHRKGREGVLYEVFRGGAPPPGTILAEKSSREELGPVIEPAAKQQQQQEEEEEEEEERDDEDNIQSSMTDITNIPSGLPLPPASGICPAIHTIQTKQPPCPRFVSRGWSASKPSSTLRECSPFRSSQPVHLGMSQAEWDSDSSDDELMDTDDVYPPYDYGLRVQQALSQERSTASVDVDMC